MTAKALRRVLLGLEAVPGTYINPTYALRAMAELSPKVEKTVVEEDIGSFAPARHFIGSAMSEGSIEMNPAYYEEMHHLLKLSIGAGLRTGTPTAYTYTMALPDGTAPTFATYTVEYTDGGSHVIMARDVFATDLEISGEAGKGWVVKGTIEGASTTLPGGITANPTPVAATDVLMANTSLYVDALYANIGNTAVAGALISFAWKLENLQHHKMFAGALYPTGRGNDKWKVSLEMVLEVENATVAAEFAKVLNTTQSAIRIKADNGSGKTATIDGMYMLNQADTLDDRDGNNIIKLSYLAEKDSSNNVPSVVVVGAYN